MGLFDIVGPITGGQVTGKKAKLIYEWDGEAGRRYRLIAKARSTAGYEDIYIIDKLQEDSLGEPQWVQEHSIENIKHNIKSADVVPLCLIGAIKAMLADERNQSRNQ